VRPSLSRLSRGAALAALLSVLSLGCAVNSWDDARRADTVAAYHQFLRDHPGSSHTREAQERIAFLRVKARPTVAGFQEFEKEFPDSPLLAELAEIVEPLFLDAARSENTPEAYRRFLERFGDGSFRPRAEGNLEYVERVREQPSPTALREFLERHPESDFAGEARATLELLESRRATAIRSLALRIDIASNVEEAERVREGFAAVVARDYREAGIEVSLIPPGEPVPETVDAWMHLDYREVPAPGTFGGRTLVAQCKVRVFQRAHSEPVWDRTFEAPAEHLLKGAHAKDRTIFGNSHFAFWEQFFVPVATWATSRARVARLDYAEPVVALDVRGERAAALLGGGAVEYIEVSSPAEPRVVARYRRSRDLSRWTGVRVLPGERVAVFGPSGAELVEFGTRAAKRVGFWESTEIGVIRDAAAYDSTLLLAGSKGMFAVRTAQQNPMPNRLIEGDLVGVAVHGNHVYLVGPKRLDVATPKQLLAHLTGHRTPLGDRLQPKRVRLSGSTLYVLGESSVVGFSLADPESPVPVARLDAANLGELRDLFADREHLYLLGERGLQVVGREGKWIEEQIQVAGDSAIAGKGRYAIVAGSQSIEVVDLSPYHNVPLPASARPAE
jgi:hypothetical protein